jgi:hypothetical protein
LLGLKRSDVEGIATVSCMYRRVELHLMFNAGKMLTAPAESTLALVGSCLPAFTGWRRLDFATPSFPHLRHVLIGFRASTNESRLANHLFFLITKLHHSSSASTICTTIPVAAPPPLQMAAHPYSPFFSWCSSVTKILEPELPNACPREIAPPLGLTLSLPSPRI